MYDACIRPPTMLSKIMEDRGELRAWDRTLHTKEGSSAFYTSCRWSNKQNQAVASLEEDTWIHNLPDNLY